MHPQLPTPPLVYIAAPYRAKTAWFVELNIRYAESYAMDVAEARCYPVCPHTNTRGHFESIDVGDAFWLLATLELMRRCDAAFFCPGWEQSSGARGEHDEALRLGLPIFYDLDALAAWRSALETTV
jgi:hypothetical protein